MWKYLNLVLFAVVICVLLWRVTMGMDGEGAGSGFDAVYLSVCATLCVLNVLIGMSRVLTRRGGHRELMWGVAYLLVSATVLVSARQVSDAYGEEEYAAYRAALEAWRGGADPYAENEQGESLLTLAAATGRRDVLEHVLEQAPAPVDQLQRAAQVAASRNFTESLRALLAHGLDINALHDGTTLLCSAAQNGQLAAAQELLRAGADPNGVDEDGCTPLIHAVIARHAGLVGLLMKHGADPSLKDNSGRDAASFSTSAAIDGLLQLPPESQGQR